MPYTNILQKNCLIHILYIHYSSDPVCYVLQRCSVPLPVTSWGAHSTTLKCDTVYTWA